MQAFSAVSVANLAYAMKGLKVSSKVGICDLGMSISAWIRFFKQLNNVCAMQHK